MRSAALEVVANNWKSIYSAEICCFQIFHRFATKYLKAYTMLRWIALKFVAAPRKGTVLDLGFSIGNWIRDRSVFMPKNKKSVNNAEIWCFYIFHRFALKYGKGYTMLRWSVSQFFIASRQNVEKCIQCWDQPLPNLLLGRARDIGKIIVFQGKRIHFRIIGILENLLFSTKHEQTVFRTKANGKLQQMCTKSLKNVKLQETMSFFFEKKKTKRERGGREGREARTAKREKAAKEQGTTLYTP